MTSTSAATIISTPRVRVSPIQRQLHSGGEQQEGGDHREGHRKPRKIASFSIPTFTKV